MNNESNCFANNKIELKEAIRQLVLSTSPIVFGTCVINDYASVDRGRYSLRKLHGRTDRKLFGKGFSTVPMKHRTFFFAFPERITSNLHYHLYVRPPIGKLDRFMDVAPIIWKQICPSGNLELDLITSETDLRKGSYYITKDCFMEMNFENFIISSEFCF
jgi:hypothetical protein